MTDVSAPTQPTTTPAPPPVAVSPSPSSPPSRGWIGVLLLGMAVAMLVGVTAVLFVRVQDAQDRADEAVTIASSQDALVARIDQLDTALSSVEASGTTTTDDLAAARNQIAALRKCVNTALDNFAQATQTGKPVSLAKC